LLDPDGVTPLPDAVWSQTARVQEVVLDTIATLAAPSRNFVFTHDGMVGEAYDENVFRGIQSPDRAAVLKCIDPVEAIHKSRHHAALDPGLPATLTLEVTRLTPEQSVAAIVAHIGKVG
jgi:hypothetical protein